jgi:BASS family bile acid:Na+ symporter
MLQPIRAFIDKHFFVVLSLCFFIGLFFPGLDRLHPQTAMVLIAVILFFGCSTLTIEDVKSVSLPKVSLAYVLRFILIPFGFYFVFLPFSELLALAVLLVALAPAGVVAPALAGILNGNPAITLFFVIVSSLLCPFVIPLASEMVGIEGVEIDSLAMFLNLLWLVFVPVILYFGFVRHFKRVAKEVQKNASAMTIILITFAVSIVIAQNRHFIFDNLSLIPLSFVLVTVQMALFYFIGYVYAKFIKSSDRDVRAYMISSGANNPVLTMVVASLYFPKEVVVCAVMLEFSWVIGVGVYKRIANKF